MRSIFILFDYDSAVMTIYDPSYTGTTTWQMPSGDLQQDDLYAEGNISKYVLKIKRDSKDPENFKKYAKTLPMAILHALLSLTYKKENQDAYFDIFDLFMDERVDLNTQTNLKDNVNAAVTRLNNNLNYIFNYGKYDKKDKPLGIFDIDRKYIRSDFPHNVYRFSSRINSPMLDIYWNFECNDKYVIDNIYKIQDDWHRDIPEDQSEDIESGSSDSGFPAGAGTMIVDSATQKSMWDTAKLGVLAKKYQERTQGFNTELMAPVEAAGTDYVNLPEYICGTYIKRNVDLNKGRSFAIIDGEMGTGKSYGVYETAKRLVSDPDVKHTVIAFDLADVYSQDGVGSLLRYINQYISGNAKEADEIRLRDLLSYDPELMDDSDGKTVFIIDGIDEVSSLKYRDFVSELEKIARIPNPDVVFILVTRNARDFIDSSGLAQGRSVFKRWDNISMKPLDADKVVREEEEDLREIMKNNEIVQTPLFVSFYREIQNLARDADSSTFLGSYGSEVDLDKIRKINNYYDLFNARTELLCAHARKSKVNPAWYSSVLPCLAYFLLTSKTTRFDLSTIEGLFESGIFGGEYEWFNRVFKEEYGAFSSIFSDEKLAQLLGTGVVRSGDEEKTYEFSHAEYMYFLAALFASRVICNVDDKDIRDKVIKFISDNTSFDRSAQDGDSRVEKMLYIPFARYTFMNVSRQNHIISEALEERRVGRRRTNEYKRLDPDLYQIAANVTYEEKDVYDEAQIMTDELMLYNQEKIEKEYVRKEFESWELINNANVILYTMTTKRNKDPNKWKMLDAIYRDLSKCAAIVLRDTLDDIGSALDYPPNKEQILKTMDKLIGEDTSRDKPLTTAGRYPIDLLGRLISNLGAARQEQAKYVHAKRGKDKALVNAKDPLDYLEDAFEYHSKTLEFRTAVIDRIDRYLDEAESFDDERKAEEAESLAELEGVRREISLIRSLITIGTDNYYYGRYVAAGEEYSEHEAYDFARSQLEEAVSNYHNEALRRQGIDPEKLDSLKYDTPFPTPRTLEIQEHPQAGSEPYVILRRAAGAYNLLYTKTCSEIVRLDAEHEADAAQELRTLAGKLLHLQYIYLKAAYIYLYEKCWAMDEETAKYRLDSVRLEINSKEIDEFWKDIDRDYIRNFSDIADDEERKAGDELCRRVYDMYMTLHPYSREKLDLDKRKEDHK